MERGATVGMMFDIRTIILRPTNVNLSAPFAKLISRMRFRISKGTFGRSVPDLDFQRQSARNPRLCQPITVAGSTIDKAFRIPGASRYSQTKRSRSMFAKTILRASSGADIELMA